jgi:hypothetical protein
MPGYLIQRQSALGFDQLSRRTYPYRQQNPNNHAYSFIDIYFHATTRIFLYRIEYLYVCITADAQRNNRILPE